MSLDLESKLRDFVEIVADMRDKQREFFDQSRRTSSTVHEAKARERRVDQLIADLRDQIQNPRLF